MIRSYTGKRSLSKRWIKRVQDIHQEKLKNMRPTLELSCPPEFSHLRLRAKKEQQREDRFTEIERANRILLERMSGIMNSKSPLTIPAHKKSLNTEVRKKFLERIAGDNQLILKRLQDRSPVYSTVKWEKEWRETEKRLKNMSEYPYKCSAGRARTKSSSSRMVLFKKGVTIENKYFLVEIVRKGDDIRIILYDPSVSESFSLVINHSEALEIMGGIEDYNKLVGMLKMKNEEILLISEKENQE